MVERDAKSYMVFVILPFAVGDEIVVVAVVVGVHQSRILSTVDLRHPID